mgnify:CR=1 FL=1
MYTVKFRSAKLRGHPKDFHPKHQVKILDSGASNDCGKGTIESITEKEWAIADLKYLEARCKRATSRWYYDDKWENEGLDRS